MRATPSVIFKACKISKEVVIPNPKELLGHETVETRQFHTQKKAQGWAQNIER